MTEAPLAHHLPRFSRRPPAGASTAPTLPFPEMTPDEPSVTITETAYAAALERARDGVREELEAEHAALASALRAQGAAAIEAAVAAENARLLDDRGRETAGQIEAAFTALHETLAAEVAAALRPLLAEAVVRRTTAALLDAAFAALADPDHPALTVRGPADRLAAIEAALGSRSGVGYTLEDGPEVVISSNGARIETRLAAALASLQAPEAS